MKICPPCLYTYPFRPDPKSLLSLGKYSEWIYSFIISLFYRKYLSVFFVFRGLVFNFVIVTN